MRSRAWLIAPLLPLLVLAVLAVAIPASAWTASFTHPLRAELLGGVPTTTETAGRLVRVGWPLLALAIGVALLVLDRLVSARPHPVRSEPPHSGTIAALHSRGDLWLLLGLMVVATIVRAPRLLESFWFDEIATLLDYAQFGPGPIVANAFTQANHTLHTLLTWVAMSVAGGVDEIVLRIPSFLASIVTVAAIWWLAREAFPDRRAIAAWSATIVAIMPVIVLSGVEARGYSLMILMATLSTAMLLRARRTGRAPDLAWYATITALGVWAHLVLVCVPLAHGVLVAWSMIRSDDRRHASATMVALVVAALMTVMLHLPMMPDLIAIRSDFLAIDGDEPSLWGPEGVHAFLQLGGSWSWWASLPALLLVLLGVPTLSSSGGGRIVLWTGIIGIAIAALLATVGNSWLYARFLLFAMPTAVLAMAAGFDRLRSLSSTRAGSLAVTGTTTVIVGGAWIADLAGRPPKQPLRDAVAEVAALRRDGERVMTIGLADNVLAYYGQGHGLEIHPTGPLGIALEPALDAVDPAWMIILYPRSVPADRFAILEAAGFVEHRRLRGWVDWSNGDVAIWRRDRASGSGGH